jgi:hypothetical protein
MKIPPRQTERKLARSKTRCSLAKLLIIHLLALVGQPAGAAVFSFPPIVVSRIDTIAMGPNLYSSRAVGATGGPSAPVQISAGDTMKMTIMTTGDSFMELSPGYLFLQVNLSFGPGAGSGVTNFSQLTSFITGNGATVFQTSIGGVFADPTLVSTQQSATPNPSGTIQFTKVEVTWIQATDVSLPALNLSYFDFETQSTGAMPVSPLLKLIPEPSSSLFALLGLAPVIVRRRAIPWS